MSDTPQARILVVEEHPRLRQLLHIVLSRAQHAVDLAASPEAAMRRLATAVYDLAIVDADANGSRAATGPRVADALRTAQPGLAVVLLTNCYQTAPQPGVDAVVAKPFTPTQLRTVVAHTLAPAGR